MSIEISGVSYSYNTGSGSCDKFKASLVDINFSLSSGSRAILVGSNGSGKTTLLKLLAGKKLLSNGLILLNEKNPFFEPLNGIIYLGSEFVNNPIIRRDISVSELLLSADAKSYSSRLKELISVLEIDLKWKMIDLSDGQCRKVQLLLGLFRPWEFLFLDEVTSDLDIRTRSNLLRYLLKETNSRNATLIYATHIFDLAMEWPTHIIHLSYGSLAHFGTTESFFNSQFHPRKGTIYDLVLHQINQEQEN